MSQKRKKVSLFADVKKQNFRENLNLIGDVFLTMPPACWPNQIWKIVTFLTIFLGTYPSQGKQKFLDLKYLTLVRVEHKPLLLLEPNTKGMTIIYFTR